MGAPKRLRFPARHDPTVKRRRESTPNSRPGSRTKRGARRVVLTAALALSSACVVPIGPDFEVETNHTPWLVSSTPLPGSIITKPQDGDPEIVFNLGDPNVADTLYLRWIFDYPGYDPNITRLYELSPLPPTADHKPERGQLRFRPDCVIHNIAPGTSMHRLMLAVADRPFVDRETAGVSPDALVTTVPAGAHLLTVSWILNMDCSPGAK